MDESPPEPIRFLVFGDLHGKILPAFRLASAWARDHGQPVHALLQVGDLGYFPDVSRLDKATLRHAQDDPLELGALDIVETNPLADAVFADDHCPAGLWFTAGNHEDFDELERLAQASGRQPDFVVDAYGRVKGIKDGEVGEFEGGPRVAAVWGVDGDGPNARQNLPDRGYVWESSVARLLGANLDVLLSHDSPADAMRAGYGSQHISLLVELAQPRFAFFGHYRGQGSRIDGDFGRTELYHLADIELSPWHESPVPGSVGVLEWADGEGTFEFVPEEWLKTFTRRNWKWQ
jgi:hypothetical protein